MFIPWSNLNVSRVDSIRDTEKYSNLYTYPDGIIFHVWNYKNQKLYTTKTKINDINVKNAVEELDNNLADGYYILCLPSILSLTYRKSLYGIFRILSDSHIDLPSVNTKNANLWLGLETNSFLADGEMIYVIDNNNHFLLKPPSKVWREQIVLGDSYPDSVLVGKIIGKDLLTRWINLSSSCLLSTDEYKIRWIEIINIDTPMEKLINTYYCFIRSLSISIDIYETWYGVNGVEDYSSQILSLTIEDFQELNNSLTNLIYSIWNLLQTGDTHYPIINQIRQKINDDIMKDSWTVYKELFLPSGLSGFDINKLRKINTNVGNR